jgi:oxygen-dependent protoporphyrinogen oxidase
MTLHTIVVGGGITGLSAAYELVRSGATDVTLLEASHRLGGKLRTEAFAGRSVDQGADAFLVRVPWALDLCRELAIEHDLVAPATGRAYMWSRGALRAIPEATVLGVPTDLDALAESGIVSADAVARAAEDLTQPADAPLGDEAVGALVRRRLGDEVHERLVAPLVGGINAGDADRLSLEAVTPQLGAARNAGASLVAACRAQREAAAATGGPVFLAPVGGMEVLSERLAAVVTRRADVQLGARASALAPAGGGRWEVDAGGAHLAADRVIVTSPAMEAARLVEDVAPGVATQLDTIDYASVALVMMAFERGDVGHALDGSGFLVPAVEGLTLTACSWFTSKWATRNHVSLRDVVFRASVGRDGNDDAGLADDELVRRVLDDLACTADVRGAPTEVRISRWPRSFPQYRPGHLDRIGELEIDLAAAAPGVLLAGAGLRGLGVPACIRQGREAAVRSLLEV